VSPLDASALHDVPRGPSAPNCLGLHPETDPYPRQFARRLPRADSPLAR
jgi:hypothetical protein